MPAPCPALADLANVLTICGNHEKWVEAARALSEDTPAARRARVSTARPHEHEAVFARLSTLVAAARKRAPAPVDAPRRRATLLSGLGWIGVLYGTARASTLLTQLAAGRLLGPVEYGRANLVIAAAAYLQIIPMLGFPLATSKLISDEHDEERRSRLVTTALTSFTLWAILTLPLTGRRAPLPSARDGASLHPVRTLRPAGHGHGPKPGPGQPLLGLKRFAHRGLVETVYGLSTLLSFWGCASLSGAELSDDDPGLHGQPPRQFHLRALDFAPFPAPGLRARPLASRRTLCRDRGAHACSPPPAFWRPARLFLNRHASAQEVGLFSAYFTATVQIALAFHSMLQAVLIPLASGAEGQRELWSLFRRWAATGTLTSWLFFGATALASLALFGRRYNLDIGWAAAFAGRQRLRPASRRRLDALRGAATSPACAYRSQARWPRGWATSL